MYKQPPSDSLPVKRFGGMDAIGSAMQIIGVLGLLVGIYMIANSALAVNPKETKPELAAAVTLGAIVAGAGLQSVAIGSFLRATATMAEKAQETHQVLLRVERLIARGVEKEPSGETEAVER
jgi:hypothetical protein